MKKKMWMVLIAPIVLAIGVYVLMGSLHASEALDAKLGEITLSVDGEKIDGDSASTIQISGDITLMRCLDGEETDTITWAANTDGVISEDGYTLLGSIAMEGVYVLTATYTDPETGEVGEKTFNITTVFNKTAELETTEAVEDKAATYETEAGNTDETYDQRNIYTRSTSVAYNSTSGTYYTDFITAVNEANTGDTIQLLSNITISSMITLSKSLTITSDGNGPYTLTQTLASAAQDDARHFYVNSGGYTLTLSNVILDGNSTGGGVYVNSGTLNINSGTTIQNCKSVGSGGGVCTGTGTHVVNMYDGATVSNCQANNGVGGGEGGGVFISAYAGTFNMYGGTVTGNSSISCGGGVRVAYGTFNMYGGEISHNTTGSYGGGVRSCSTSFNMSGGTVCNNTSTTYGGGIELDGGGSCVISGNAIISGNTAGTNGGGIYTTTTTYTNLSISASAVFSRNRAATAYSATSAVANSYNTYISTSVASTSITGYLLNNWDINYTAGTKIDTTGNVLNVNTNVFYTDLATAVSTATSGNTLALLTDLSISAVQAIGKNITLTSYGSTNYTITQTGAVRHFTVNSGFTLTLGNITLDGNGTDANGGGVEVIGSLVMNNGATIQNCMNTNWGGGVYVRTSGGNFIMNEGSIIQNCKAPYGGGVILAWGGCMTMNGGTITGNVATSTSMGGGGVELETNDSNIGKFTMNGGAITDNKAYIGGGVNMWFNGSIFEMNGGTISGNTSTTNGGGVYARGSDTVTLSGTAAISSNTATLDGGGIYTPVASYTNLTIASTATFSGNTAWGAFKDTNTYSTIQTTSTSVAGYSPVNNYDINVFYSTQTKTITASTDGETQKLALTTGLPTGWTDITFTQTDSTFAALGTADLSNNSSVPANAKTYGSTNANQYIYATLNTTDGSELQFTNAAAYTNTDIKYFTLTVKYSNGVSCTINVTLSPVSSRTLDVTVPIVNSVEINPNTATDNTITYSEALSVKNNTYAPLTVALSGISAITGYEVALPINDVGTISDWQSTRDTIQNKGVAFAVANTTNSILKNYLTSGTNETFGTLTYKDSTNSSLAYKIAIYHPKLAAANSTFGFNFTYDFAISESDVS